MSVRGDTSYPQANFSGGLNLRDKADAIQPTEAIDCIDVTFTDRGAIQQRGGYKALTKALTNRVESLSEFYTTSGTAQLLAGAGTRLEGLSSAGAVVASATGLTKGIWDFARFGKPNSEVAYAGNGSDTLRKWNGSEWTAPTASVDGEGAKAMPKAGSICVWPEAGNRLVATRFLTTTGGPGGATSSPSHVWFSDPGDAESWHTKEPEENQVQLFPGNGEAIMAAIAWKEFVFVFKETCFFVFYSSGSQGEGSPTFNFRPIEAGVGMVSPRAVCAHHTGVYFMSRQGIYRTTGQEPELVSSLVEPLWTGDASPFFTGGTISQSAITECAMGVDHEDRIRLTYSTGSETRGLIYDPQFGWWSLDSIPASCYAVFRPESAPELVFGYSSGEKFVGRHRSSLSSDEGKAIEGFWRSGWFDLGNPDVKTIRSSKVWGTGIVEMSIDKDFAIQSEEAEELNMRGGSGSTFGGEGTFGGEDIFGDVVQDLLPAFNNRDQRGTVFSVRYSSSTLEVPWSVHRADFHLREIAKPSTLAAA